MQTLCALIIVCMMVSGCTTFSTSFTGHCAVTRDTVFGVAVRDKGVCHELSYSSAYKNFKFMESVTELTHGAMYDLMEAGFEGDDVLFIFEEPEEDPRFIIESTQEAEQ